MKVNDFFQKAGRRLTVWKGVSRKLSDRHIKGCSNFLFSLIPKYPLPPPIPTNGSGITGKTYYSVLNLPCCTLKPRL